jgi:hypothetical protein
VAGYCLTAQLVDDDGALTIKPRRLVCHLSFLIKRFRFHAVGTKSSISRDDFQSQPFGQKFESTMLAVVNLAEVVRELLEIRQEISSLRRRFFPGEKQTSSIKSGVFLCSPINRQSFGRWFE